MTKNADSFLNRLDSLYPVMTTKELVECSELFKRDLQMALCNQPSSLPSILNPVCPMQPTPGYGVAVSIGGTNGYVSLFRVTKKRIVFVNRRIFSVPKTSTQEALFHLITKEIFAVSKKRAVPIGIGFAYPLKPLIHHGFIDGELIAMTKGRKIEGLVGKRVGEEYHKFLIREYAMDTTVAVANDAVCLLLGAEGADVAGVAGTGVNFAYWEKRAKIAPLKLSELNGFCQTDVAINIEAKNFDKIPGTQLRKRIDGKSMDPGGSLSEKEAGGAYLHLIFNAGAPDLLDRSFPLLTKTDEINDMLTGAYVYPKTISLEVKSHAKMFAERIFRRSSQIVALELCGILQKIGKTTGVVPVIMEGGIFWRAKNYSTLVPYYVHQILPDLIPSFTRIYGSSRKGIATLARNPYTTNNQV